MFCHVLDLVGHQAFEPRFFAGIGEPEKIGECDVEGVGIGGRAIEAERCRKPLAQGADRPLLAFIGGLQLDSDDVAAGDA